MVQDLTPNQSLSLPKKRKQGRCQRHQNNRCDPVFGSM